MESAVHQAGSKEFVHRPVLAEETPRELVWKADGLYVDATFGRGGHTRRILARLSPAGRLFAFDRDPEAVAAAASIVDPRFRIIHAPFSRMSGELAARGVAPGSVSGIMMDIGVSSPQIDDASRGFSFRSDGPLDMRMDTSCGMTAAQWLAGVKEQELAETISRYGEERYARRIARAIVAERAKAPVDTTFRLASIVEGAVPRSRSDSAQHPATRTFQAIRIRINGELDELSEALRQAGELLAPGGRLAVISFHSLEDRIVKRFFEAAEHPEREVDPRLPLRQSDLPSPLFERVRRIRPGEAECAANPRARSATLRVGERSAEPWRDPEKVLGGGR
ncbi:MAG: 16S rRNA (cytosine(1402)-N(4))-methyltransferase RsmH [Mesosutterella sp.]|nr:16S rRNA (cytosine(1402)-N(4))-methyltransferase RsmH [Mesosutterella sp.]